MNSFIPIVFLCFFAHSFLNAMENDTSEKSSKKTLTVQFKNDAVKKDADEFLAHLQGFKRISKKTLKLPDSGQQRLSGNQRQFLEYCLASNTVMQFKIGEKPEIVYRKMAEFPPENKHNNLDFWKKLLAKNKINKALYDEQEKQTEALYAFFNRIKSAGCIQAYPRLVDGKAAYKAAL